MPTPDPGPSATLEAIRDRAGVVAKLGPPRPGGDLINAAHRSAADVPSLVAALEAALKLADDWKAEAARMEPSGADAVQPAMPGNYLVSGRIGALEDCVQELREGITRALNGDTDA